MESTANWQTTERAKQRSTIKHSKQFKFPFTYIKTQQEEYKAQKEEEEEKEDN
jgi:hypothetical protein